MTLEEKLKIAKAVGYKQPYHITGTDNPMDFPEEMLTMSAKEEKKKSKLTERINQLENELRTSLQKKAAGPAINVAKYTTEIKELRKQLAAM